MRFLCDPKKKQKQTKNLAYKTKKKNIAQNRVCMYTLMTDSQYNQYNQPSNQPSVHLSSPFIQNVWWTLLVFCFPFLLVLCSGGQIFWLFFFCLWMTIHIRSCCGVMMVPTAVSADGYVCCVYVCFLSSHDGLNNSTNLFFFLIILFSFSSSHSLLFCFCFFFFFISHLNLLWLSESDFWKKNFSFCCCWTVCSFLFLFSLNQLLFSFCKCCHLFTITSMLLIVINCTQPALFSFVVCLSHHFFSFVSHTTFFVCLSHHFFRLSLTLLFSFVVCLPHHFFHLSVTPLFSFVCHTTFFNCLSHYFFHLSVTTLFFICLSHHFFRLSVTPLFSFVCQPFIFSMDWLTWTWNSRYIPITHKSLLLLNWYLSPMFGQ